MTSFLIKGVAYVFVIVGGLLFWIGGRALHEFANIDRISGEAIGILLGLALVALGLALRAIANRIETQDDGSPVSLSIDAAKAEERDHEPGTRG
jgi:putative effector of murein hydrolase